MAAPAGIGSHCWRRRLRPSDASPVDIRLLLLVLADHTVPAGPRGLAMIAGDPLVVG